MRPVFALAQPILAFEVVDSGKFPFVVCHQRVPECDRVGSEQQVVSADRLPNAFEAAAKLAASEKRLRDIIGSLFGFVGLFTLDGKLGKLPVNLYHRNEAEFDAILVTNIYMSENGERNLLASHDPPGNPALQNPDKFLDNKALIPKARFLLNRFRLFEPIVFRDLADIPVTRANFNPVRQYRDELNRQMKTPKKPQKP